MATSRQSARNCGPRRWASAWCSCSRKLNPTNPRDLGCRMALKFIHRRTASRCNDFLRLPGWPAARSRWAVLQGIGIPPGRDEIDADWRRRRLHDIEQTRGKLRSTYTEYDPAMRRLLDYAGLDPDHAL